MSLDSPRKLPKDWWSGTPITENQPAFITGQAPRGPVVHTFPFTFWIAGWPTMDEGGYLGGAGSARTVRVFGLLGFEGTAPDYLVWKNFSSNWSVLTGQWESWVWKEASCLRLHSQWVVAQGCSGLELVAYPLNSPPLTGHGNKACESVPCSLWHVVGGGVPCPLSTSGSCLDLRGIQCCSCIWGWGRWTRLPPLTLCVTQQSLAGAVTQSPSFLLTAPLCTGVF